MGGKHGSALGNAMGWEQHGNNPGTARQSIAISEEYHGKSLGNTLGRSSKYLRNFMVILREQHRKSMDSPRNIIGVV